MAIDTDSEYSSGIGRIFWQLVLLVAVVFCICYYNNNFREKKIHGHDRQAAYNIPFTPEYDLSDNSIIFKS